MRVSVAHHYDGRQPPHVLIQVTGGERGDDPSEAVIRGVLVLGINGRFAHLREVLLVDSPDSFPIKPAYRQGTLGGTDQPVRQPMQICSNDKLVIRHVDADKLRPQEHRMFVLRNVRKPPVRKLHYPVATQAGCRQNKALPLVQHGELRLHAGEGEAKGMLVSAEVCYLDLRKIVPVSLAKHANCTRQVGTKPDQEHEVMHTSQAELLGDKLAKSTPSLW
jgi:hypothetical protein